MGGQATHSIAGHHAERNYFHHLPRVSANLPCTHTTTSVVRTHTTTPSAPTVPLGPVPDQCIYMSPRWGYFSPRRGVLQVLCLLRGWEVGRRVRVSTWRVIFSSIWSV